MFNLGPYILDPNSKPQFVGLNPCIIRVEGLGLRFLWLGVVGLRCSTQNLGIEVDAPDLGVRGLEFIAGLRLKMYSVP